MPSGRRWSSGLRSASTAEWSGCRGVCFSGCSRSDPVRAVRRGLLSPADQVRVHRRTEAAPAPVDRGRECRGQRAGFCGKAALRRRSTPDRRDNDRRPYRRPRAYLNRHPPSSRRRRVFPGTPRAFWPAERRNLEIRPKTSRAVAVPMRLFILRRVCCGVPIGSRIRGRGGWGLGRSLRW
jgi:hypothetical protein